MNIVIHTNHPGQIRDMLQHLVEIEAISYDSFGVVGSYIRGVYDAAQIMAEKIKAGEFQGK